MYDTPGGFLFDNTKKFSQTQAPGAGKYKDVSGESALATCPVPGAIAPGVRAGKYRDACRESALATCPVPGAIAPGVRARENIGMCLVNPR